MKRIFREKKIEIRLMPYVVRVLRKKKFVRYCCKKPIRNYGNVDFFLYILQYSTHHYNQLRHVN